MKSLLIAALASTLSFSSAYAAAETYTLDPGHTNVVWRVNHLGFSTQSGKFGAAEGTLTLDEAAPEKSKVEAKIPVASLVTGNDKLDTHLKSKDFFNLEAFPTATFVSDKVEPTGKDTAKVTGTLTLLGVAKPVTLDVKLNKIGEHPMSKKKSVGFNATTTIKRSDFGMSFGVPNVSDEVSIDIAAEGSVQ